MCSCFFFLSFRPLFCFQDLLRQHVVVTLFLTMLVGAGGNAGNQSAIKVRLVILTCSPNSFWRASLSG